MKSPNFERKKILIIFGILATSYLARAIFNTIQPQLHKSLQCLNYPNNYAWCAFIIFFYTLELFLPLQILFRFQYFKNTKKAMGDSIASSLETAMQEDPLTSSENGSLIVSFLQQ